MARDFQQCGMCDQQRLRPACAYAQSDQCLCESLEYSMTVKLLTEHHLEFVSLKGGCGGLPESTLVKMSNYWKSHAAAHFMFDLILMTGFLLLSTCLFFFFFFFLLNSKGPIDSMSICLWLF